MSTSNKINLDDLFSEQDLVNLKTVRKYMVKIHLGEKLEPVCVSLCPIVNRYYLYDGNHRAQAHRLYGLYEIDFENSLCTMKNCTEDKCSDYFKSLSEMYIKK